MLCRSFNKSIKELSKFIRRALRRLVRLYQSVSVKVASDFWIGRKFVEFFGFRNQGQVCASSTTNYDLYELRVSWL